MEPETLLTIGALVVTAFLGIEAGVNWNVSRSQQMNDQTAVQPLIPDGILQIAVSLGNLQAAHVNAKVQAANVQTNFQQKVEEHITLLRKTFQL